MTVSKVPKALILFAILALAGAALVSGCGGGGSSSAPETTAEEAPAGGANEESADQEAGGGEGKAIFSSNCAGCHTLKAAGASGEVGPNLDELEPDEATVEKQVINGGGGMPSFGKEGALSSEEIKEVAAYVST